MCMHQISIISVHKFVLDPNSMQQSPCCEANRFLARQEIPRNLWNLKVRYHIHKRPPPAASLSFILGLSYYNSFPFAVFFVLLPLVWLLALQCWPRCTVLMWMHLRYYKFKTSVFWFVFGILTPESLKV
jgi:hypothetical protein